MTRQLESLGSDYIESELWRGDIAEAREAIGPLLKKFMDNVFLAGGFRDGCHFLDDSGKKRRN